MNQAGCQISSMLSDSIKKLVTLGVEVKVQNKIISQEVNKSFFPYFLSILSPHPPDSGSFSWCLFWWLSGQIPFEIEGCFKKQRDRLKMEWNSSVGSTTTPISCLRPFWGDNSCLKIIINFRKKKHYVFFNFILCNFLVRMLRYLKK